jgi:hypothetical protein
MTLKSKSQTNFQTLNKSLSGSSIDRLVSKGQPEKSNNYDVEIQLDTIKERLKKGYLRRRARNQEIKDRV